MAFAFAKGEDPGEGTRRLAHQASKLALDHLEGNAPGDPVHETRRVLKRARALVRLCRGTIGKKASRAANHTLGDAADVLSGARDAAIVRSTFEALSKRTSAPRGADAILAKLPAPPPLSPDAAHDAATLVRAFDARVDGWPRHAEGFDCVREGLLTAYEGGVRALAAAREEWRPEHAHELRKRAKDLRFDLELLVNAWPEVLGPLAEEVDRLGEHLGDDHDLAVLGARLHELDLASDVLAPWIELVERRRRKTRKKALPLAARIYADPPSAFVDRLEAWFDA